MPDTSWRPLPVSAAGIPSLLVSTSFTEESYSVRVTDLAHVWAEGLDRRAIFVQAFKEDISIDLSQGHDQLPRLLQLLQAAFDTGNAEHKTTSLSLSTGNDDMLVLGIGCELPKPLRPLKWSMHLKKSPSYAVATDLVLPLIRAQHARAQEVEALLAALREKDSVIEKLADKVEANIGLEHVFTSLSGKRKITRAVAEARIKGLAPFVEADLRWKMRDGRKDSDDPSSVLEEVFGGKGLTYEPVGSEDASDWWLSLGKGTTVNLAERSAPSASSSRANGPSKARNDDEFQVQATPPHLMSPKKRNAPVGEGAGSETSDGEDDVAEIPDSVPLPAHGPVKSRLGAIGRKVSELPSSPPPESSAPLVEPARVTQDDETASEGDPDPNAMDLDAPSSPPPPRRDPSPPPPRRRALGRIGGKATTPALDRASSPSTVAAEPAPPTPPSVRRRLGAIGRRAPSPSRDSSPVAKREESSPAPLATKEPEETAEEKSARRRAELQQNLQKKAAAGPAKKKRKF